MHVKRKQELMILSLVSKVMFIMQRVSKKVPIMQVGELDDGIEFIVRTLVNDDTCMDP